MSWKMYHAPLNQGSHHQGIQTNAPEYQKIMHLAKAIQIGPTTPPSIADDTMSEFQTPRPERSRVIHKEKLRTIQHGPSFTTRPEGGLPTAHVSPSLTVPTTRESSHPQHPDSAPDHIRRSASTNDFRNHQQGAGVRPEEEGLHEGRRWNSYQDVNHQGAAPDEYQALQQDPNATIDQTRLAGRDSDNHHQEDAMYHHGLLDGYGGRDYKLRYGDRISGTDYHGLGSYSTYSRTSDSAAPFRVYSRTTDSVTPYSHSTDTSTPYTYLSSSRENLFSSRDQFKTPQVSSGHYQDRLSHSSQNTHMSPSGGTYGHDYGEYGGVTSVGSITSSSMLPGDDLTSWQQRHQEQLLRQQMEVSSTRGSHHQAGSGSAALSGILDPHKTDAVRRAADHIIREKDAIIDKQRVRMQQLEKQSAEARAELQGALLRKGADSHDAMSFKMQEMQYENAAMKAQWSEALSSRNADMDTLERKLGEAEHDLQQLRLVSEKQMTEKMTELRLAQEQVSQRDSALEEREAKQAELTAECERLRKQLNSTESYMADLPTPDENSRKSSEVKSLKEEKVKFRARINELEKRLMEANKAIRAKQELLVSAEANSKKQDEVIQGLEADKDKLRAQLGLAEGGVGMVPEEDLEELRYDNERLRADCDKARKMLESKHKHLKQLELNHGRDLCELEARMNQESSHVLKLREELTARDDKLKKLSKQYKQLTSQTESLSSERDRLSERVQELEARASGDAAKLERRLAREMDTCFAELQGLVSICMQHAEGKDPNISMLLGVKSSSMPDVDGGPSGEENVHSLKERLAKVRQLRQDIDKLRETVSEKLAEDMGENLNCITQ